MGLSALRRHRPGYDTRVVHAERAPVDLTHPELLESHDALRAENSRLQARITELQQAQAAKPASSEPGGDSASAEDPKNQGHKGRTERGHR